MHLLLTVARRAEWLPLTLETALWKLISLPQKSEDRSPAVPLYPSKLPFGEE